MKTLGLLWTMRELHYICHLLNFLSCFSEGHDPASLSVNLWLGFPISNIDVSLETPQRKTLPTPEGTVQNSFPSQCNHCINAIQQSYVHWLIVQIKMSWGNENLIRFSQTHQGKKKLTHPSISLNPDPRKFNKANTVLMNRSSTWPTGRSAWVSRLNANAKLTYNDKSSVMIQTKKIIMLLVLL